MLCAVLTSAMRPGVELEEFLNFFSVRVYSHTAFGLRICYELSGAGLVYPATLPGTNIDYAAGFAMRCPTCYALSGTRIVHRAMHLCGRSATPGTDLA
eukprot:1707823-Rhodomonas_salina.5